MGTAAIYNLLFSLNNSEHLTQIFKFPDQDKYKFPLQLVHVHPWAALLTKKDYRQHAGIQDMLSSIKDFFYLLIIFFYINLSISFTCQVNYPISQSLYYK